MFEKLGRRALVAALVASTTLVAACATETTYRPATGSGFYRTGYTDTQIEPNRFRVTFGGNSVTEHEFVPRPWGTDNPHGNVFDTTSKTLSREMDAARNANGETGRYWKVINPNVKNSVGKSPGYKLSVTPSPLMLAQEGSFVRKRGGFATKHVWVTPYEKT